MGGVFFGLMFGTSYGIPLLIHFTGLREPAAHHEHLAEVGRAPRTVADWRSTTPESVALSKELKRNGFRFVGPTTVYAFMQSAGLVDDHVAGCWVPEGA